MLTGSGLASFVATKIGTPYIYGAKGKVLSMEQIQALQNMYGKKYVWDSDLLKAGKVCCDCSGLISWYTGKMLGSLQLYNDAIESHPISDIANAPIGATLWKEGHVGVYIGNGYYIAEDGSAYGCRKNLVSNARFTHWLKQSFITYENEVISISYKVHAKNIGDMDIVKDGQLAGTTGQNRQLEALYITNLSGLSGIGIIGQAHCANIGWQDKVIFNSNNYIGTKGQNRRLEAIKLSLFGINSDKYNITYRVHMQNIGWGTWVKNGEIAGTVGQKRHIEAIEIKVTKK